MPIAVASPARAGARRASGGHLLTSRPRFPYHRGVPTDRIERFTRILASNPENVLARFSLGQTYFDAGRFDQAIPELQRVVEQKPDWMLAYLLLGRALIEVGRAAEARPALERGLRLAVEQGHQGPQADFSDFLARLP